MSRRQRVDKLEQALAARDSVLLWVEEVRRYSHLDDYARATLEQPNYRLPLEGILERVRTAAENRTNGADPAVVQRAIREESRDAVFLYALVIEMNQAAWNLARDWAPIGLALTAHLRCLTADPLSSDAVARAADAAAADAVDRGWRAWSGNATAMLEEVEAATAAQAELDTRYFNGRSALFVDGAEDLTSTQALADHVSQMRGAIPAQLRAGMPEQAEDRTEGMTRRAAARVAAVTEDAKITAFQLLGEPLRAIALIERRLGRTSGGEGG